MKNIPAITGRNVAKKKRPSNSSLSEIVSHKEFVDVDTEPKGLSAFQSKKGLLTTNDMRLNNGL